MTLEEKYHNLLLNIGIHTFHPFQDNYYNPFASFADSVPQEIMDDAERAFKATPLYAELEAKAEERSA